MTLRIGTSGWQYDHWRGDFFDAKLPKARWFARYAEVFDTVELNNSFYRQPKDETWDKWHDMAPPGFRYAVKANRFLTHVKRLNDIDEPLELFLHGVERLKSSLGPMVYQLPPNMVNDAQSRSRLESFLRLLPSRHVHVLEFRHDSWHTDEILDLMRAHRVAFCCHDMAGLHPPFAATSYVAYVRLHGRHYGGNYGPKALDTLAGRIRQLARETDEVWVFFNNDLGGHAPRNALSLRRLLEAGGSSDAGVKV